jgi:Leucine-rich repeat (LRR) protein
MPRLNGVSLTVALLWFLSSSLNLIPSANAAKTVYENYRNLCKGSPIISRKHDKTLQWLFKNVGEANVAAPTSPQNEAACWMMRSKKFSPQRYVMGVIYYATQGSRWDINTDWMTNKHECSWFGVTCNVFKTVVGLDLGYIKVDGLVPREMGLLSSLRDLDLHGNDLQGVIPHKLMVGLKKLEYLRLHMNGIFGSLHKEISNMANLKELYIFGNYIAGTLPKELFQMKKLGM